MATPVILTDSNNRTIGMVIDRGDGRSQGIHSPSMQLLGWYDRKSNQTFKVGGALVGNGDLTGTLLRG